MSKILSYYYCCYYCLFYSILFMKIQITIVASLLISIVDIYHHNICREKLATKFDYSVHKLYSIENINTDWPEYQVHWSIHPHYCFSEKRPCHSDNWLKIDVNFQLVSISYNATWNARYFLLIFKFSLFPDFNSSVNSCLSIFKKI